jgi:hypothetical protein
MELLMDMGVPVTGDGKNDYAFLVKKLIEITSGDEHEIVESHVNKDTEMIDETGVKVEN